MKHINFRISTLAIIVLAFTSCSTIRVNYYGNKVVPVQKIALVSTMIGKIQQSPIPLLDAAVFNAKTNKIADQIMDMQKKAVDKYQVLVASGLKNNFNCQVIYADSLHNLPGFVVIKEKYNFKNGLRLKSDNYPFIFLTLILSLQASYAAPLILLAQNRQADRDRIALNEDRAQNARSIADTEYLTRELASLRIALGDVATRDYLRNELGDMAKEIVVELRKPESDAK